MHLMRYYDNDAFVEQLNDGLAPPACGEPNENDVPLPEKVNDVMAADPDADGTPPLVLVALANVEVPAIGAAGVPNLRPLSDVRDVRAAVTCLLVSGTAARSGRFN